MSCIVVTRGGVGDALQFESAQAADDHPLVQYGDAYLRSSADVTSCYSVTEMGRIALRLGDPRLAETAKAWSSGSPGPRDIASISERLWTLLCQRAQVPPSDPAVICQMVTADRRSTRATGITVRSHPSERDTKMSETQTTEKTTRPIPRQPKYADSAVITFGSDKEGKPYGPDHNPKKAGSKAHEAFAKYTSGMTVAEAKAAGITLRDIDFDAGKGFIALQ